MALFVFQNPADFGKVQGLRSEMSPVSSYDAHPAVSIKAEVLSDEEAEEDPVMPTFVGVKVEPEVSFVSMPMLGQFHKYRYPFLL
jgi:hypothetical protein